MIRQGLLKSRDVRQADPASSSAGRHVALGLAGAVTLGKLQFYLLQGALAVRTGRGVLPELETPLPWGEHSAGG